MRGNDRLDNCLTNQLRIAHADAETNLVQQQNCHLDCSLTVQEPEAEQIYLLKDSQFALESSTVARKSQVFQSGISREGIKI